MPEISPQFFQWIVGILGGVNIIVLITATWKLSSLNTKFDYVINRELENIARDIGRNDNRLNKLEDLLSHMPKRSMDYNDK